MGDESDWQASALLRWPRTVEHLDVKLDVARRVAARAADGQVIGIGSGSSAYLTLWAIGDRVRREQLQLRVVTTSYETEIAALTLQLPSARLGAARPDWSVDGADEIDRAGRLLKGRGGALFRERLLWSTSAAIVLVIDPSKHVDRLGARFPIPIEVHPDAAEPVSERLRGAGARDVTLRLAGGKDGPVFTENGFLILDASFDEIPPGLSGSLKAIPGVLESGLFEGYDYDLVE